MIVKIPPRSAAVRASSTRKSLFALMAYLLGRGEKDKAEVFGRAELEGSAEVSGNHHVQPRVVAGGGSPVVVHGAVLATGGIEWGGGDEAGCWREEARLAGKLAAGMCDLAAGSGSGSNAVWHAILAAHPQDGDLDDGQWAAIAARAMAETGYDRGDGKGVQWVAVRHGRNDAGADHIHIAAVLIRPDGSRPSRHNDAAKLHRAAAWAEREFGLVRQRRGADAAAGGRERLDRDAPRSEVEHERKRGEPYPRPAGIGEAEWAEIRGRLAGSAWTRSGRARIAVLSAAARAVSRDHLEALLNEQGYRVSWRYSAQDPTAVTGWSITAPATRDGRQAWRRPKSYRGSQLGPDCTWPAVHSRISHRNLSLGLGIVAGEDGGEAMLSRDRMLAAGWGEAFIAEVVAKDLRLARREGDAAELTAAAYWLRDAAWQVAWRLEGSRGVHGVWTDAAYLYAAVAVDGPPPGPPQELLDLIAEQDARIAQAWAHKRHALTRIDRREAVGEAWDRWADEWNRATDWADWDEPLPPPVPPQSPAAGVLAGAQLVRLGHYTARCREASAALRQASQAQRAASAVFRQLAAEERMDGVWLDQVNAELDDATAVRARAAAAVEQYLAAEADWRERMGRLLVDARAHGEPEGRGSGPGEAPGAGERIAQHLAAGAAKGR